MSGNKYEDEFGDWWTTEEFEGYGWVAPQLSRLQRGRAAAAAFWRFKILRRDPWKNWTQMGYTTDSAAPEERP